MATTRPTAGNTAFQKATLRRAYRAKRALLPASEVAECSAAVCKILLDLFALRPTHRVGLYAALASEVALWDLFHEGLSRGIRFAFPSTQANSRVLLFRAVDTLTDLVVLRGRRLREPRETLPQVAVASMDFLCVPGVAFSESGARLGMGGGYYDATLSEASPSQSIGVTFGCCLLTSLPTEAHDRSVDIVVTERGIVPVPRSS